MPLRAAASPPRRPPTRQWRAAARSPAAAGLTWPGSSAVRLLLRRWRRPPRSGLALPPPRPPPAVRKGGKHPVRGMRIRRIAAAVQQRALTGVHRTWAAAAQVSATAALERCTCQVFARISLSTRSARVCRASRFSTRPLTEPRAWATISIRSGERVWTRLAARPESRWLMAEPQAMRCCDTRSFLVGSTCDTQTPSVSKANSTSRSRERDRSLRRAGA